MTPPWWERLPGRLESELRELEAAGIRYTLDEQARDVDRVIRLDLEVDQPDGTVLRLAAAYPDHYPYVRVAIRGPDLDDLTHHRNPFSGDLCLLGRETRAWNVDDTLGGMLGRIPLVLATGRMVEPTETSAERGGDTSAVSGQAAAASDACVDTRDSTPAVVEQAQAEPVTDYYTYEPEWAVLVDSAATLPAGAAGNLTLAVVPGSLPEQGQPFLAAVAELTDHLGRAFVSPAGQLLQPLTGRVSGRWVRLDSPPPTAEPAEIWKLAVASDPTGGPRLQKLGPDGSRVAVIGIVLPEEVGHREVGEGWLFVMRLERRRAGAKGYRVPPATRHHLARTHRAGPLDLLDRVPDLVGLGRARVLIVGLGALGGAISVELGRAGIGKITGLDFDHVEAGTLPRHVAGFDFLGRLKTEAVGRLTAAHSPYITVAGIPGRLGNVRWESGQPREDEQLREWLADYDLVVDATAEEGINHLLSAVCREMEIPYICVWATNGGWGGAVARIDAAAGTGCWVCLQYHLADGTIPQPPASPRAFVQPAGCADPTFTGAGVDLDAVSNHAARVTIATAARLVGAAYPDAGHDVAVLALRTSDGHATVPTWRGHPLSPHLGCGCGS
jgi:molybdopterin/thiamine biosynthesis adenylyltransferase